MLALPVLAVDRFDAGAFEMGVLEACATAAFLLIGLPAGVWVDRMRTRRVLVVSDVVRALVLATLPVALLLGHASLLHLYAVALVVGACTVFFDVAWQSYLPVLVDREQLVDANSKLSATGAVAGVVGPALGGGLLRVVAAPLLVAIDACTFVVSALFVRGIQDDERLPDRTQRRAMREEVAEGLRFVLGHLLLRRITWSTALANVAWSMVGALLVLFMLRELDLSQSTVGIVFAFGAVGGLIGAVIAAPLGRIIGPARLIPLATIVSVPGLALTPLATVLPVSAAVTIAASSAIGAAVGVVYNVTQVSFRQRLCPPHLLGRMNASIRFIVWGTLPLGSLAGGVLGTAFGITSAMWVAVGFAVLSVLPVLLSPLARMRDLPDEQDQLRV